MVRKLRNKDDYRYFNKYMDNIRKAGLYCKTLYDVYKKPSEEKVYYWERIKKECVSNNGVALAIIYKCPFTFSAGYTIIADKDNVYFVRHTVCTRVEYKLRPNEIKQLLEVVNEINRSKN